MEKLFWLKFICHAISECSCSFSPNFLFVFSSEPICSTAGDLLAVHLVEERNDKNLRELKELQCSQDSGYSVVSHELRIPRKESLWSAASSPARTERSSCDKVTCQRQLIRHGMTPVSLPEKVSELVKIKGGRVKSRTACTTNSTASQSLRSGSSGKLFTAGSSPHNRLWDKLTHLDAVELQVIC